MTTASLRETVNAFVAAFNADDIDTVMAFFADSAEYITFDGKHFGGRDAIRAAFLPQFRGDFGRIRFYTDRILVDAQSRQAALTWVCEHAVARGDAAPGAARLPRLALQLLWGRRARWRGVDILQFDGAGQVIGKYTYTQARLPLFRRVPPRS